MFRQCRRCGHVSAIVTGSAPAWIAALQPTNDRPAPDWPGCLD
jgi:hypothetical protein